MALNLSGTTGIVTGNIASDAVTTSLILNANVTPAKLSQPMTLAAAQNATGTSVDFTGIPSWVKRITVMLNEVSTDTGGASASFLLQIGDSGGVETSGYVGNSLVVDNAGGSQGRTATDGFVCFYDTAAHTPSIVWTLVKISGNTWIASLIGYLEPSNMLFGSSAKTLSDTLDRVRLTTVNTATFDGGSVNILYEG